MIDPIPPVCGIVTFLFSICLNPFASSSFPASSVVVPNESFTTVKGTGAVNLAYPSGALISSNWYSPSSKPDTLK